MFTTQERWEKRRPVPTLYDINGSAAFFNKTDYGMVVDRNDELGQVLVLRADDDRLVDEGTCNRYAQVYTAPDVDTIAGGGHNFATLTARAAVEEKTAAFIKAHL